jgi:AbrB family looped-hinge helix DNA binding protein
METYATAKGQITIPSSIRREFGIKAGTRIHIEVDEQRKRIILTPITRKYIHSLRGKYRGRGLLKALTAEKEKELAIQKERRTYVVRRSFVRVIRVPHSFVFAISSSSNTKLELSSSPRPVFSIAVIISRTCAVTGTDAPYSLAVASTMSKSLRCSSIRNPGLKLRSNIR